MKWTYEIKWRRMKIWRKLSLERTILGFNISSASSNDNDNRETREWRATSNEIFWRNKIPVNIFALDFGRIVEYFLSFI